MKDKNKLSAQGALEFINKPVLMISGITCLVIMALTLAFPTTAETIIQMAFSSMTTNFGWFYMLVIVACMIFCFYVALSRYGNVKLGGDDEAPEHSFSQWFFMLFTAGMGVGLLFYSVAEPMSIYLQPATGAGETAEAAKEAMNCTFLNWGISPWVGYAAIGGALAYVHHRLNKPAIMSSLFVPLVGEKATKGVFGKIIDSLAVCVTVFGITTSLGLGAMQVAGGLSYQFGFEGGTTLMVTIIVACTFIFVAASFIGIDKAISVCSNINIWVMIGLALAVLFLGNTTFLLNFFVETLGSYITSLVQASFFTDTFGETNGFVAKWTIFFWAWWIAWIPFTGGFIARISRGRTLRQFILGVALCPCCFSFVFMTVFGGSAIDFSLNQGVTQIADAVTQDTSLGLFATLQQFPLAIITIGLVMVLLLIFFVAHLQVGSLVICEMLQKPGAKDSPLFIKLFWGCMLGAIAAALLLAGGLSSIQTISIIGALPFGVVVVAGIFAFAKALSLEFKADGSLRTQEEMLELYEKTDFTPKLPNSKKKKETQVPEGATA